VRVGAAFLPPGVDKAAMDRPCKNVQLLIEEHLARTDAVQHAKGMDMAGPVGSLTFTVEQTRQPGRFGHAYEYLRAAILEPRK